MQEKQPVNSPEKEPMPFPEEAAHLRGIKKLLDAALVHAEEQVERLDEEYQLTQRYMVQNRSEIDPHEMFQDARALQRIDSYGAFAVDMRARIAKLKDSPYFARIDFYPDDGDDLPVHYIGRFAFTHEGEQLIYDWRAPVSSMFYDCKPGRASYTAPCGEIAGELTRKRQFKIANGEMEYALESSDNIQDDVLQKELSHTSDEKMKSIIATIQKEQNAIIRNEKADTLIIQGVAGSGKTSIALHRIAFLLYRFKDRLSAQNVTILSPNAVFGDYISNVLPELGEEPIFEVSMDDIAEVQLGGVIGYAQPRDPLETEDKKWAERVRFKATPEFLRQLDEYVEALPGWVFEAADYIFNDFTIRAAYLQERYDAYKKLPVKKRLLTIAEDILDRIETDNFRDDERPRFASVMKNLKAMLKAKDTLSLYKDFLAKIGAKKMFVLAGKKTLEWNDVYPFLYVHAAFEGLLESPMIRHLVVDEMQDYTPVQFAVLGRLFRCPKTILGDFGQAIDPHHSHTLDDIRGLYDGAELVELTTSYRSTYEIIGFARQIRAVENLHAIERHGEEPRILRCADEKAELAAIRKAIRDFEKSDYATLGIITKTNTEARKLHEALAGENVHLIAPDSQGFHNGVSIASVQMSKGLEFDEVLLPDVDAARYHSESDRGLLYVACTRAMHGLTLLHCGERSTILMHNA